MKKIIISVLLSTTFLISLNAQLKVGKNPKNINPNALIELESDSMGLLLPRVNLLSTTSFLPLKSHVQGLVVYNKATSVDVTPGYFYNDGTKWVKLIGGAGLGPNNTSAGPLISISNGEGATLTSMNIALDTTALKNYLNNRGYDNTVDHWQNNGNVTFTNTGSVGIGTQNPLARLNVLDQIRSTGIGPNSGQLSLSRLNGTEASPTNVLNSQLLGSILFSGHNGTNFSNTASINCRATVDYTTSNQGSHLGFNTTLNGTNTAIERMRIDHNGFIGVNTLGPRANLHINREINAAAQTTGGNTSSALYNTQLHIHNPTIINGEGVGISFGLGGLGLVSNKIVSIRSNNFAEGHLAFFSKGTGIGANNLDETIERMRITDSGNVGIGTTMPNYRLDVKGTARIENTPTITTATKVLVKDPSSGQISEQLFTTAGMTSAKAIFLL
jgi:hypothetical protein